MTRAHPIVLSGSRLRQEALVFIGETGKAAEAFGKGVRKATAAYVGRLKTSGERFAQSAGGSAVQLKGAVHKEADFWRELVLQTRGAYGEALQQRVGTVESGVVDARQALRPTAVRVRALKTAHVLLQSAQTVVDQQLEEFEAPKKAPPKAPPKRTPRKATPASRNEEANAPIRNYDKLTAKDVVARIQRLTPPEASALIDYEQGRKNRTTVIRAAKQRVATG